MSEQQEFLRIDLKINLNKMNNTENTTAKQKAARAAFTKAVKTGGVKKGTKLSPSTKTVKK